MLYEVISVSRVQPTERYVESSDTWIPYEGEVYWGWTQSHVAAMTSATMVWSPRLNATVAFVV